MYECSIGPSSTLGFSKVFFGLLIFWGIFRYLLIENSGILVFWYFSCNFICWCVWYYWQNSYISATLCTKNDGTSYARRRTAMRPPAAAGAGGARRHAAGPAVPVLYTLYIYGI